MRVVFPKHIQRWILAGMSFSIGPLTLSIVQLFVVAIGIAAGLWIFNAISKSWSKALAAIVALPILIIFLVVAFFKVSELGLLPFMGKFIANNFFDTNKKFQVNFPRLSETQIVIARAKLDKNKKRVIEQKKDRELGKEMLDKIESGGLL